jgi:hypothetical protein
MNEHRIIRKILNTAPYQLPPVVHTGGTYSIDIEYRGEKWHYIGPSLHECLSRYHDFTIRVNDKFRFKSGDFNKLPIQPGSAIGSRS